MHDATPAESGLTPERLDEVTRRLVDALHPRAIYLFGSHLYGTPRVDSDIDLLVVLGDEVTSAWDQRKRAYEALHGLGLPVELHFVTAERFERFRDVVGSLQREVHQKGRVLYAA